MKEEGERLGKKQKVISVCHDIIWASCILKRWFLGAIAPPHIHRENETPKAMMEVQTREKPSFDRALIREGVKPRLGEMCDGPETTPIDQ